MSLPPRTETESAGHLEKVDDAPHEERTDAGFPDDPLYLFLKGLPPRPYISVSLNMGGSDGFGSDGGKYSPSLLTGKRFSMLHYAVVFFVIALIAAMFGFGGIAAGAAGIAKLLFLVFIVLAVAAFLINALRGKT